MTNETCEKVPPGIGIGSAESELESRSRGSNDEDEKCGSRLGRLRVTVAQAVSGLDEIEGNDSGR